MTTSVESRRLAAEMLGQERGSEVGGATHKGVAQATKVRAILHLFREDVARVAFASYMRDPERPILDELAHIVLALLHVTEPFCSTPIGPDHTRLVVVVDGRGLREVRKRGA